MKQRRKGQSGQTLVILVGGMIALIVGTGFVVDAGFAFSEQRATQNSADSAAKAGAAVLAQRLGDSSTLTDSQWDERVRNSVLNASLVNRTTVSSMHYTDWQGEDLPGDPVVGAGVVPPNAAGVRVVTRKQPGTYLVRLIGINTWNILQTATAVSGPSNVCEGGSCILLPVTFPVTVYQCGPGNTSIPLEQQWADDQEIILPLCGGNPGSVGWIDWTPPAGGNSEIVDVVYNPPAVEIPLPSWQYITATGEQASAQLEEAINSYMGQVVQVPMFDSTCPDTPTNNETSGCLNPGGTGVNQWYHIPKFLSFKLTEAFTNGENGADCAGEKQCIIGRFVSFVTEGTVTAPGTGPYPVGTTFSVQLIK